jgi:subtilisin family serine protease/subtilisin-like proprotein convertase family protein
LRAVERLEDRTTPASVLLGITATDPRQALHMLAANIALNPADVRVLYTNRGVTTLQVGLRPDANQQFVLAQLTQQPQVAWAVPERVILGETRDFVPDDPQFPTQSQHSIIHSTTAWNHSRGAGVLVAVLDDGIDTSHPDLAPNLLYNPGEVPGDGVDNDGNGYIDDVNGWDFSGNDGDVRPNPGDSHGTHVAGLIAAALNNAVGGAGVAGAAKILPVRWFGSGPWTSTVVAQSIVYAVNSGAKILNISYNLDGFVGDPVVTGALNLAYDAGCLIVNSAGNTNQMSPARQGFDQSLLLASADASGAKSGFSNFGSGIDLTAPGNGLLSTLTGGGYGTMSGTSMAAPIAAGVAALIWAQHPDWNRDQVASQLVGSSVDTSGVNSAYEGLLGNGRMDAGNATTQTIAPPRFAGVFGLPPNNGVATTPFEEFMLRVGSVFAPGSMSGNFSLVNAGSDEVFDTADDFAVALTMNKGEPYRIGTNELNFKFDGPLLPGKYRFRAYGGPGGLTDPFGRRLDGNSDGIGGDSLDRYFRVEPQIAGVVFADYDANGSRAPFEPYAAGQVVYLDLNHNASRDGNEPFAVTGASGRYYFGGLVPGSYTVRLDLPADTQLTKPTAGFYDVSVTTAGTAAGRDFAINQFNALYGRVFNDPNQNAALDPNEMGLAGWLVLLDGDGDGQPDPDTFAAGPLNQAIPDNGAAVNSTVSVNGIDGTLTGVELSLDVAHSAVGDLVVTLTSPSGQTITLINQRGNAFDEFGNKIPFASGNNLSGTTFSDDAGQAISSITPVDAPFGGRYRPEDPLSSFIGSSANGTWTVSVRDGLGQDVGAVLGWRLKLQTQTTDRVTTTDSLGRYSFTGLPPAPYSVRVVPPPGWIVHAPAGAAYNLTLGPGQSIANLDFAAHTPPPRVTIASIAPNPRFSPVPTVPINFDMPVIGFDLSDLELIRNGVVVPLVGVQLSGSGANYMLTGLSAATSPAGTYSLRVVASNSGITNQQGTLLANDDSQAWWLDDLPPSAAFDPLSPTLRVDPVHAVVLRLTEAVEGLTASDFRLYRNGVEVPLTGATLSGTGMHYVLGSLTTFTSDEGQYTLILPAHAAKDAAGNLLTDDAVLEWTLDPTLPLVDLVLESRGDGKAGYDTVVITFSEWVNDFDLSDLELSRDGTTVPLTGAVLTGDGLTFTLSQLDVPTASDGVYTLSLRGNHANLTDDAGNPLGRDASVTWSVDRSAPTVGFAAIVPTLRNTVFDAITLTFSEVVVGFDLSHLRLTHNGVPVPLTGVRISGDGTNYVLQGLAAFTQAKGMYTLSVQADQELTDREGNALSYSVSTNWTLDRTAPSVVIDLAPGQAAQTRTPIAVFRVTFSEAVAGFDARDVQLNTTATGNWQIDVSGSGEVYHVTVTGMTSAGLIGIRLPAGVAIDYASNPSGSADGPLVGYEPASSSPASPPPPFTGPAPLVVGTDAGTLARVWVYNADGSVRWTASPFGPNFTGGVRVATGDVTGDGVADVLVTAGPGGPAQVVVLDGVNGTELRRFAAFEPAFTGGVFIAAADFDNDGFTEIIVTPDQGGGPRVRVFDGRNVSVRADFFGIADPDFRGGARVAAGDLNGDGVPDLAVGAGFGGGPRVALYDGATLRVGAAPRKLVGDFLVFEPSLRNGVYLAVGDLNGDGSGDLIVGAGPGGGPRVLALSGAALLVGQTQPLANFFAGDVNNRGGVRVAVKDLDGDNRADVVAGAAPGGAPRVVSYLGQFIPVNGTPPPADDFLLDAGNFTGGIFVG